MNVLRVILSLLCVGYSFVALAVAQAPSAAPVGIVTGHVLCGDTQRPARFAQVMLFGIPSSVSAPIDPSAKPDTAQVQAALKSAMDGMSNLIFTQTMIDGSYSAPNVPPGDYYVFASVSGYVQPNSLVQAVADTGADLHKLLPGIPTVHVVAERSTNLDLTVTRGAAISGRVVWDDGSSATHVAITLESTKEKSKPLPPEFAMLAMSGALSGSSSALAYSDDRGEFRLAGLAPGEYRIKATLQTHLNFGMSGGAMDLNSMIAMKPLTVYAPATFHKAEAKPATLKAGEEQRDQLITFNLGGLHSVTGRVTSLEDHHGINSASVELTDTTDKEFVRSAGVDAAGNFSVDYVPAGTYTLSVSNAADTAPSTKKQKGLIKFTMPDTLRSYEDAEQTVIVTDHNLTGQNIDLKPSKETKKSLDLNEILGPQ